MGLQAVPMALGANTVQHPANLFRNFAAAVAGRRTGAFRRNDFTLTPSASAMQMTVGSGEGVIIGQENTSQGGYYVWSNASEVLNWPAASGSPRIDTLLLRVIDTDYGSDASAPQALWQIVQGTPAASPVAIADSQFLSGGSFYRPGAWWRVAEVRVNAGITNLAAGVTTHNRLYARVGRHTIAKTGAYPSDAQDGDQVTDYDTYGLFHRENGLWVPVTQKPFVRLVQQAAQSIPDASSTSLTFGASTEIIDTHNFHDTAVNNTRVTPNVPGLYRVTGTVVMAATTAIAYGASILFQNGSFIEPSGNLKPTTTNNVNTSLGTVQATMAFNGSTDYVELAAFQNSGGARNTNASGANKSVLEVEYVRPLP